MPEAAFPEIRKLEKFEPVKTYSLCHECVHRTMRTEVNHEKELLLRAILVNVNRDDARGCEQCGRVATYTATLREIGWI